VAVSAIALVLCSRSAGLQAGLGAQQLSPTAAELKQKFERRLQEIAARVDGVVGYSVLDLTSGDRVGHLENAVFPTASTIKLAIVYELFKQAEEGKIRLDDALPLDRSKAVGGTGVLVHLGTPTLSIRDYATLMVTLSDNTATNVLIDRLGMDNIGRRMQQLHLGATKLRRHMMDTEAARRGDENVSTPADIVGLLKAMYGPPDGGRSAVDGAIALLKKPKESRLRRGLPAGVDTADKPGELDGVRVDAGVVFVKNRPYVLCVMTTFLKSETEGERAIEEMSRVAYEYFSRLAEGADLGRRIPR
jgi:beta-lactamase class A